jgi:oligoendopeptidase F
VAGGDGESLGPAVTLNEGYEHYWAYVTHFVQAPFYVYAYAFGDLLVSALMEKRRQNPAAFAPLYEQLLAAGRAARPTSRRCSRSA